MGYFSLVWNIGGGLSESFIGGPSTLTEGIAAARSDRVQLHAAYLDPHRVVVNSSVHALNDHAWLT